MFMPKEYRSSAPFNGDIEDAFNIARTSLLSLGFEISMPSKYELHAIGPGMHSNQQPALLGVSELKLHVDSSIITAVATLGAAAKMKAFVYIFPPALILLLYLVFFFIGMNVTWHHALWVVPWFFISPWMGGMIERKTTQAVDSLVRGMAQCGGV
jgi:hypothetical protein